MRRIAALIDPPDIIGILGLVILVVFVAQYDWRLAGIVVGLAFLLVGWVYASAPKPPPPKAD